jgi:hypothetical protein
VSRYHPGAFHPKIEVGTPHFAYTVPPQEDETRRIHVGKLAATQLLELRHHLLVMCVVEGEKGEPGEVVDSYTKGAGRIFAQAVEKPPVRLRHNREGGIPTAGRIGKESDCLGMIMVGAVEKSDEDPAVEEDRSASHGRERP